MTKKNKTLQSNTLAAKSSKVQSHERFDFGSWREQPISQGYLEEKALEIIDWAENDEDALKLTLFYKKYRWYEDDVRRWRKRCANFDKALRYAKMIIGDRREIGALKRKLSEGIVSSSMAMYDPEWKEIAEWRARLRADADRPEGNTQYIIVPPMTKEENS